MPLWRHHGGKLMVSSVNSRTNATSKRWLLWEIGLRFALNSTPGWVDAVCSGQVPHAEKMGHMNTWWETAHARMLQQVLD